MELFTRYEGLLCKEPGCGKFIRVGEPHKTNLEGYFAVDVTLDDGMEWSCSDGHRHTYYSHDVVETDSPDGKGHLHYRKYCTKPPSR